MRLVFGAGYTGSEVARIAAARGEQVLVTVRSPARAAALADEAFEVSTATVLDVARAHVDGNTHVILCFPPDGTTDAALAPLLTAAKAISYVSTTGVYGATTGAIDDQTHLPADVAPKQRLVLDAEAAYRAVGATVLRSPGIYGADRGLHCRVIEGKHRLPGEASGFLSRIHVHDLARLLLATDNVRGETFVVGDLEPARQRDVVRWICEEYGCPMPSIVPPEEVHESLRADRRIDASRVLDRLKITLAYPSFRFGMRKP